MAKTPKSAPHVRRGISVAESAERWNVCTKTIRRLVADGSLPAYRLGKRLIRIDPDELDQLFREIPTVRSTGGDRVA